MLQGRAWIVILDPLLFSVRIDRLLEFLEQPHNSLISESNSKCTLPRSETFFAKSHAIAFFMGINLSVDRL